MFANKAVLDGITTGSVSNWNTAYSWGDHSIEGYLKAITREQVESVLTGSVSTHWHDSLYTKDLRNMVPSDMPLDRIGCTLFYSHLGWSDLLWMSSWHDETPGGVNALSLSKTASGTTAGIWHLYGDFKGASWKWFKRLAYQDEVPVFANKAVLDGITAAKVSGWDSAVAAAHQHANKSVLDGITSSNIANWNAAYSWGDHSLGGYLARSEYTASDVLSKLKTVDGDASGLDADLLDGYHRSSFWGHYSYTVDASQLDENMYYPVTIRLSASQIYRIAVIVGLNSGTKPSWSMHALGFSVCFEERVNGSQWGTQYVNRTILTDSSRFCSEPPIGGVTQMVNSSNEVIYVRGGGKYFFFISHPVSPVLHTETYTANGQSISPTSEYTSLRNSAEGGGMSVGTFQAKEGKFGSLYANEQEVFHRGNYNLSNVDGVFRNVQVHGEIQFSNGARIVPLAGGAVSVIDSTGENEVIVDTDGTFFKKSYTIYHS